MALLFPKMMRDATDWRTLEPLARYKHRKHTWACQNQSAEKQKYRQKIKPPDKEYMEASSHQKSNNKTCTFFYMEIMETKTIIYWSWKSVTIRIHQ